MEKKFYYIFLINYSIKWNDIEQHKLQQGDQSEKWCFKGINLKFKTIKSQERLKN
jgi:hypothetical protein